MKKTLLVLLTLFLTHSFVGQNKETDSLPTKDKKTKKVDLTVMPFLSYNRNLDFMFGAIPMAMYRLKKNDTISPKSLSGVSAVYTTNKSYIVGAFNRFYFDEDKWRGTLWFFRGDINSQFYMDGYEIGSFYNYTTNATMLSVGVKRKIIQGLYGGLNFTYSEYDTAYEENILDETTTITHGLELNLLYDTRSNVYYPMSGAKIDARWITYPTWFGNDENANRIKTTYNAYFPMRKETDVLAARFSGDFGLGTIPFEQQTVVGGNDIRGYSEGKYRGNIVMAVQGEYRYNLKRMGFVGFFGVATLFDSDNEDFNGEILPGGGIGYRYQAFKKTKFNIGLDAALGKDDWGVYFRIGEAF